MRKTIVALALPLILASCSSSPPTTEQTAAPEVTTVQQDGSSSATSASAADVGRYFELLATYDPDEQSKAIELAAPKSAAAAYATHQAAVAGARLDSGDPYEEEPLEATNKGYTSCSDATDESTCTEYADIKTVDGRVSSFTVKGKSIEGRLSLGKGDKVRAGKLGTVEFVSAYKTASAESLFVNLLVRSDDKAVDLNQFYQARYREPGGRQAKATDAYVSDDLDSKSSTRTTVIFAKAKPGGVVTIEIVNAKTYADATAKIHI